ncbi:hypothetical protein KM043_009652 [Ampulex compressa]|nr:hypothetical protein KM043_009652 [Ampulex compressa]
MGAVTARQRESIPAGTGTTDLPRERDVPATKRENERGRKSEQYQEAAAVVDVQEEEDDERGGARGARRYGTGFRGTSVSNSRFVDPMFLGEWDSILSFKRAKLESYSKARPYVVHRSTIILARKARVVLPGSLRDLDGRQLRDELQTKCSLVRRGEPAALLHMDYPGTYSGVGT